MNRVAGRAAIIDAGFTVGTEANVAPTAANEPVRTIIGQNPAAGTMYPPGSAMDINVVSYPVKDAAPSSLYANWVTNGRPACWAYPRQCRGDADGKKLGTLWVSNNDLILLKAAISKNPLPANGTCSDFDHKKLGTLWVSGNDLNDSEGLHQQGRGARSALRRYSGSQRRLQHRPELLVLVQPDGHGMSDRTILRSSWDLPEYAVVNS